MTARDDYPLLALHADDRYAPPGKQTEIRHALAEIDRLRRWKAEATIVLSMWDEVAGLFTDLTPGLHVSSQVRERVEAMLAARAAGL